MGIAKFGISSVVNGTSLIRKIDIDRETVGQIVLTGLIVRGKIVVTNGIR